MYARYESARTRPNAWRLSGAGAGRVAAVVVTACVTTSCTNPAATAVPASFPAPLRWRRGAVV